MSEVGYASPSRRPSKLLGFMARNIAYTGEVGESRIYERADVLVMREHPRWKGRKAGRLRGHDSVPVWSLVPAGSGGLESYICDKLREELHYQVLDREADFCFTVTMNGCTFTTGRPTEDGCVLVSRTKQADRGRRR